MQNEVVANFLEKYSSFRQQIRGGGLGKTARFWVTYMNHVSLVFSLLCALKNNDYYLCGSFLSKMMDLFFSFDGLTFVRYLCYFSLFLINIEKTYPGATELLKLGAIMWQGHSYQRTNVLKIKPLKKHLCDMPNVNQARAGGVPAFQVS